MRVSSASSVEGELCLPSGERLRVQNDALRGTRYGGNKARKFAGILEQARRLGKTRLVSVGAIGSNHVVATAIFAREAGLAARCYVVPQPEIPGLQRNARAALAAGAELVPVATQAEAAIRLLLSGRRPGTLVVPVGGSSVAGTEPYVQAASELEGNALRTLVVALGSGGTAVGLAIGAALLGAPWRVHAVLTSGPGVVVRTLVHSLALRVLAQHRALQLWPDVMARLRIVTSELGAGYALPTAASEAARVYASSRGLALDPVYTAKAFAHVLALDARGVRGLAYWHTASAVDLSWLGPRPALPPALSALFRV